MISLVCIGDSAPARNPKGTTVIPTAVRQPNVRYTESGGWLAAPTGRLTETPLRTGVTAAALDSLPIIAVELPPVRSTIVAGEPCGLLWTSTAAVTLRAPISGLVTIGNAAVSADPDLVRLDPFGAGWLFAVLPATDTTIDDLLTPAQYLARSVTT